MSIKSLVKFILPRLVSQGLVNYGLRQDMRKSVGRTREAIFTDIYERGLWGNGATAYCSGTGSKVDVLQPYLDLVSNLISKEGVKTIVDIGCGDFEVGRRIVSPDILYIGCDIFPGVVAANQAKFGSERISFLRLDAVADTPPKADLIIIRQVFQHLSNDDITAILANCGNCPLLLVTDEQVSGDTSTSNVDLSAYHGTRRVHNQGLNLQQAPFYESCEILLEHSSGATYEDDTATYLRTVLIRRDREAHQLRSQHSSGSLERAIR